MPLLNGCDQATIDANIEELASAGYNTAQAYAIAMDHWKRQGCEGIGERGNAKDDELDA